jgi:hypothetical protein
MNHVENVEISINELPQQPSMGIVFDEKSDMIPVEFQVEMMKARSELSLRYNINQADIWYKNQLIKLVKKMGMVWVQEI